MLGLRWGDQGLPLQPVVIHYPLTQCNDDDSRAARFLLQGGQRTHFTTLPNGEKEFLERIGHRALVLMIGESAFTDSLCRLARMLDYEVMVCEPRRRFAESIISADFVDESWPDKCIEKLTAEKRLDSTSVIIVCTHDSKFDEPALMAALQSNAGFIGALGSRRTVVDPPTPLLAPLLN